MDRLQQPPGDSPRTALARSWPVVGAGLIAFALCLALGGDAGLWLPALGMGVALLSWTSWWLLPLLMIEMLAFDLVRPAPLRLSGLDSLLLAGQIGLSWWAHQSLARGARWLEDPRLCVLFLVLVPGVIAAGFALVQALLWTALRTPAPPLWSMFGTFWLSRILGLLVPLPLLLALVTPWLTRHRFIGLAPSPDVPVNPWPRWSRGARIEVFGLALSASVLAVVLLGLQDPQGLPPWSLWGVGLLIVVWSALRQGLRGGAVVAGVAALAALLVAQWTGFTPRDTGPLQGYLLAQCSTALLVGVSAGWIQASEARYRHVFNELPLVLYSAHLPRPLRSHRDDQSGARPDSRADAPGPTISREAIITLVSRASRLVFDRSPEQMTGPYAQWLDRIVPEDRELVVAALGQLVLQTQPVACEYRIVAPAEASNSDAQWGVTSSVPSDMGVRWVRDTLTPHYTEDDLLDGWEGFVEDISDRRKLAHNLRRTSMMLQGLIANLPVGVLFVHGPQGFPLLANARARQLLGQREDAGAPLNRISQLYRLHRPDGSEYPPEELPVAKALAEGATCSAVDVVVHRTDGRRVTLATWAAPVHLGEQNQPEAAVWVLQDLAAVQPAESLPRGADVNSPVSAGKNEHAAPPGQDLPKLLRLIRDLAEAAQSGLPADHPTLQALRRVLELSSRAGHLATQVLAARPAKADAAE